MFIVTNTTPIVASETALCIHIVESRHLSNNQYMRSRVEKILPNNYIRSPSRDSVKNMNYKNILLNIFWGG